MARSRDSAGPGGYFALRNVSPGDAAAAPLPHYLRGRLPEDRAAPILDIGCGFGQVLLPLQRAGYTDLAGIDVSPEAADYLGRFGIPVDRRDVLDVLRDAPSRRYAFVAMTHVLEHLEKPSIVPALAAIREKLLRPGGALFVRVPNAQASTGCYWAYEDFTHSTLFTAGSLSYVLRAAGFASIEFLDSYDLELSRFPRRQVRRALLRLFDLRMRFWNRVTNSAFHAPSPVIYSWELRCLAR